MSGRGHFEGDDTIWVTQPSVLSSEFLSDARASVERSLGSDLARKASDRFVAAAYTEIESPASRRASAFGLEAISPSVPTPVAAVVEFDTSSALAETSNLKDRTRRIEALRTRAYLTVQPVYQELERLVGSSYRPDPLVLGTRNSPTLLTQVCWLNGTVRTHADPRAFSEVAAHEAVLAIDLPRRIVPETVPNIDLLGVPAYIEATGIRADNTLVAVIDSEVASSHPALAGRVVQRQNYTSEAWSSPDRHGTAVAGILAADHAEYQGVAPGAIVYNYKVLATNSSLDGNDFDGALAIQRALEDGAVLANCSWGAGPAADGTSREARAVDSAWALGMIVVKSAGNRGPGQASMTTPADADGVIVVGSTGMAGTAIANDSSRGPVGSGPNARPGPHLVAPGGGQGDEMTCCLVAGSFGLGGWGTSYAAPQVSGMAALLLSKNPDLTPDEVRTALVNAAVPIPGVDQTSQGAGLAHMP